MSSWLDENGFTGRTEWFREPDLCRGT